MPKKNFEIKLIPNSVSLNILLEENHINKLVALDKEFTSTKFYYVI